MEAYFIHSTHSSTVMISVVFIVCVCRSVAVRLETEVAELRRHLQQAVDHKLEAERQKQVAQEKVNKYTPDASPNRLSKRHSCVCLKRL